MDIWDKKELLDKYPVRNTHDYSINYVLGYGDAYWYPGMKSKIVTLNEKVVYDPWNRAWETDTKWESCNWLTNTYFRWVTVDGKKIDVYLIQKNYDI